MVHGDGTITWARRYPDRNRLHPEAPPESLDYQLGLSSLNGRSLATTVCPAPGSTDDPLGRIRWLRDRESKMQLLLLVGSIVLSVGAALGTASLFLSLLLRVMSKLR